MSDSIGKPGRPCADHEARLRELEERATRVEAEQPGMRKWVGRVESDVDRLAKTFSERDKDYQLRFDKLNRTIAWGTGALAAVVFFAQVVLPLVRSSTPQVIRVEVPAHHAPAIPAPTKAP
jgi:hypothetical protein